MTILGTPQVGSPPGPQCWAVDGRFVWVIGDHFTNQKLGNDGDSVFAEDVGFHWGRRQTYFFRANTKNKWKCGKPKRIQKQMKT